MGVLHQHPQTLQKQTVPFVETLIVLYDIITYVRVNPRLHPDRPLTIPPLHWQSYINVLEYRQMFTKYI